METTIEERKKAEAKYEDAVASGNQMAVLAQHVSSQSRNLIRVNMGNFPPRSLAKLTCFMYTELPIEDDSFCFRLPLSYIPKYMFGNAPEEEK